MSFNERKPLYEAIEKHTQRPLIAYVTSHRPNAPGMIAGDATRIFTDQILSLPKGTNKIDLLIHSLGGDGLASWRIISILREHMGPDCHIRALIPNSAFSAATILALGCNEIFLHPLACLGPVDPQITVSKGNAQQKFGYEDLLAFGDFIEEELGVTEQQHKTVLFDHLMKEVQPTVIGVGKRSSGQAETMSVELLKMHTKDENKVKTIASALNKSFYSHGHAVSKTQAQSIGLNIAAKDVVLEDLIWKVYEDFEMEMEMRQPFDIMALVLSHPSSAPLLQPPSIVNIPGNTPPQIQQQIWQQVLQGIQITNGVSIDFVLIQASIESLLKREKFRTKGKALATRKIDMEFMVSAPTVESGWESY